MCFCSVENVRQNMNKCGAAGRPFLFAVDFEMTEGIFVAEPLARCDKPVFFDVCGVGNGAPTSDGNGTGTLEATPMTETEYAERFDVVRRGLMRGNSFLVNLTVRTPIKTDISPADIFVRASAPYKLYVPERFVCFSPERFVLIENGRISTNPMKGTISAAVPDAAAVILADPKETAEHNTVVDLLRNDIGINAVDVKVDRFRYIDRIPTRRGGILQVSSEVSGRLEDGYMERLGDIIFDMLPAGSVSGAPKRATVDIICEAENMPRGYYTGVFGYFDGTCLDSAVLIRFIELDNGRMFFRSGGGITAWSDCGAEYREVIEKIYLPLV